ncbi:MAG: hydroxypyruvate isomerase family protein [Ectothiorhodospiraceae bacterium]|nr:hydroxypyruvate isomerase family protein [Chromatiales bacterium]MCP5154431.1 hydroxypyruvate isomerase family protein [Ectothiorhodospiraceae bacterium]
MPRFAANLSMMFTEVPFLDRFERAARAGFTGVEFLFPYEHPAAEIARRLRDNGLSQALFNLPPGNWEAGERGMAALAGREAEFAASVDRALEYAEALDCPRVHVMAGLVPDPAVRERAFDVYVGNLRLAAERAAAAGRELVIEPINNRDIPGYFINYQSDGVRAIEAVGSPVLGLQLDLYHCQIMEGDLAVHVRELAGVTRHIQIAGVPERHEPDVGEINYPYLFRLIDEVGYQGWIGCEYRPRGETEAGLGWLRSWERSAG